jgi:hypothetical protein
MAPQHLDVERRSPIRTARGKGKTIDGEDGDGIVLFERCRMAYAGVRGWITV